MPKEISINYSEVTFITGKQKNIRVWIDNERIDIPVDEGVFAYFSEQFLKGTPAQKRRLTTVMHALRASYLKGLEDSGK